MVDQRRSFGNNRGLENAVRDLIRTLKTPGQTQTTAPQTSQPKPAKLHVDPFGKDGDYRLFVHVATDDDNGIKANVIITEGKERKQVVPTDDTGFLREFELLEFKEEVRHIIVEIEHPAFSQAFKETGKSPLFWEMDLSGPFRTKEKEPKKLKPVTFEEASAKTQRNADENEGSFLKRFFTETRKLVKDREEIV